VSSVRCSSACRSDGRSSVCREVRSFLQRSDMNDCVGLWTEDDQCAWAAGYVMDNWRAGEQLFYLKYFVIIHVTHFRCCCFVAANFFRRNLLSPCSGRSKHRCQNPDYTLLLCASLSVAFLNDSSKTSEK
jgi:hypothetical protein